MGGSIVAGEVVGGWVTGSDAGGVGSALLGVGLGLSVAGAGLGDVLALGDPLGVAEPAATGALPRAAMATGVTKAALMNHLVAGSMNSP